MSLLHIFLFPSWPTLCPHPPCSLPSRLTCVDITNQHSCRLVCFWVWQQWAPAGAQREEGKVRISYERQVLPLKTSVLVKVALPSRLWKLHTFFPFLFRLGTDISFRVLFCGFVFLNLAHNFINALFSKHSLNYPSWTVLFHITTLTETESDSFSPISKSFSHSGATIISYQHY